MNFLAITFRRSLRKFLALRCLVPFLDVHAQLFKFFLVSVKPASLRFRFVRHACLRLLGFCANSHRFEAGFTFGFCSLGLIGFTAFPDRVPEMRVHVIGCRMPRRFVHVAVFVMRGDRVIFAVVLDGDFVRGTVLGVDLLNDFVAASFAAVIVLGVGRAFFAARRRFAGFLRPAASRSAMRCLARPLVTLEVP